MKNTFGSGNNVNDIFFGDGWHDLERSATSMWKWSDKSFTLYISANISSLKLIVSTPIGNTLIIESGTQIFKFDIIPADNEIIIPINSVGVINGKVTSPFIPKNEELNSNDERTLGICLKKVYVVVGINEIELPINVI